MNQRSFFNNSLFKVNGLDDLYKVKNFYFKNFESHDFVGQITEKEKFKAAKQILLGLAILYALTIIAYIFRPQAGDKLLNITTITFPPLATLILTAYFREKSH